MFKAVRYILTPLLILGSIFIACTDNPLEVSPENLLNEGVTQVQDTTLYAIQDTTHLGKTQVATQFSTRLMAGEFNGITSRLLLRFTSLPLLANFKSVKIVFAADGFQGAENPAPFSGKAYPVLADWDSNIDSIWSDYTQNIDQGTVLGEIQFTASGADTMMMNQNGIDKFNFWADSANYTENYGLFIDVENPTFMKYMLSRNSSDYPRLYFTYDTPDDTTLVSDSLEAAWDAFHYTGVQNTQADLNYASTLTIYRTLLKFDLNGFAAKYPDGVEVVSANLEVPVDLTNSVVDSSYGERLFIWKLLSKINDKQIEVDSISGRVLSLSTWDADKKYLQIAADGSRKTLARAFIQPQLFVVDSLEHGFAIDTQDETPSVTSFAFYKRTAADPALRPRLILKYHLPSSPRF